MPTYKIKELIDLIGKVRKYYILNKLEQAISNEYDVILGQADASGNYAAVLKNVNNFWDKK